MNAGSSGLMFLPLPVGGIIGITIYILYISPKYEADVDRFAPHPVPPEHRLPMAQWGGLFFAGAFFWFGWTSFPSINYWAPLSAGLFIGLGTNFIFLALFNYIMCVLLPRPSRINLTDRFFLVVMRTYSWPRARSRGARSSGVCSARASRCSRRRCLRP